MKSPLAPLAKEGTTPAGWHGRAELRFGRRGRETILLHSGAQAPLKVQRPFYPEGSEVCHGVIVHTAGGMVGGDRLSQAIQLEPNARAVVTTPAASKVYRSNGQPATQTIQLQIDADACLEWLPQETILFEGAVYDQNLRVDLAPGAIWLGWEVTRLGRSARGERFVRGEWRSRVEVWQGDCPVWCDRQRLLASEATWSSPHGLAHCPVVATLAYIHQPVSDELLTQVRQLGTHTIHQGTFGTSRLMSGLLCRYRGHSSAEVRNWFTSVWDALRLGYLNRPACLPRVWQR